ncbi:ATP-binding protein [Haloplanus salilacus]|uniref:ATP-binding protein n=1 Tax=Haloplanus salilacus TaxID=2949994 RepID=UPI0030CCDACC
MTDTDTDTETITVADVSEGPGGDTDADPGTPVSLPVVELLTGRGFVTGKSGSGKSNTASVLVENLLANNFPVLVVDTDGEYYGLKEEFELLHAGADDECDIQVSPEHAEKIASLALESNVPIILDVSGYLDDEVAKELLLSVAKHLFAKEKKLKKPFLMLVEEVHEYIPEGGGLDETGKMLIKIGKRGRKHGLGIVGISQRPADVKKDFITQCDWLVWHRLTWNNDTNVVSRIIDAEHANAVEDLGDGEAFLMTDWSESVRRVQFHRKRTFDAGATPGLDDFERPELKSVSDDLVSDLREISDEQERRESELADLRQELDRKEARIEELEAELAEARDLSRMADQFAQAMLQKAEAPYRGGDGRNRARASAMAADQIELDAYEPGDAAPDEPADTTRDEGSDDGDSGADEPDRPAIEPGDWPPSASVSEVDPADGGTTDPTTPGSGDDADAGDSNAPVGGQADVTFDAESGASERAGADGPDRTTAATTHGTREAVVADLRSTIEALPDISRRMLAHYRRERTADPVDAHVAAGGTPDQPMAYGRNRPLRTDGFVEHVDEGRYRYALRDRVAAAFDGHLDGDALDETVRDVERSFVDEETLAAEETDPQVADEQDEVEVVDGGDSGDGGRIGDDGFVDEDAVVIEGSDDPPASADDATRRQMAADDGSDPRSDDLTDAEFL